MCIRKKWNKQKDKLSNFKDKATYENKIKYNLFIYFISKIIHLNNYFIKNPKYIYITQNTAIIIIQ
jgi:hypothetical protein